MFHVGPFPLCITVSFSGLSGSYVPSETRVIASDGAQVFQDRVQVLLFDFALPRA